MTDSNLAAVLETLTDAERAVVEGVLENAGKQPKSEATSALTREAIRKVKARLKRKARRKRDTAKKFKWLN